MSSICTGQKRLFCFFMLMLSLLVAACLTAGCTRFSNSGDTTKTKDKTTKGTSSSGNGVVKPDSPGSDIDDFKRYPGSRRTSYTVVEGENNKKSGTIIYETTATVSTVVHKFKDQATEDKWKVIDIVDTKYGQILIMTKVTRKLSVSVTRREHDKTTDVVYVYREY